MLDILASSPNCPIQYYCEEEDDEDEDKLLSELFLPHFVLFATLLLSES